MAKNHHAILVRLVFTITKSPAHRRLRAQHGKEIRRNRIPNQPHRIARASQIKFFVVRDSHQLHRAALLAHHHQRTLGEILRGSHQSLGLRIGQRPQQHSIHQAENRGVRADAQRQSQRRNHCEPRIFPQRARGIAQILQQIFQPRPRPLIVRHVLNHACVAQLAPRRRVRLRRRFSARLAVPRRHLQMARDFFIQFVFAPLAVAPRKFHASLSSPAGPRIPAIACEICAQRDLSDASFFFPAALSRYTRTRWLFSEVFHSAAINCLPLQPVQRRIQRARIHLQYVARVRANGQRYPVPVLRSPAQRLQNQQIQRPLQQLNPVLVPLLHRFPRM